MKLWKRNLIAAAIVLFVCGAVYLNWSYTQVRPPWWAGGRTRC